MAKNCLRVIPLKRGLIIAILFLLLASTSYALKTQAVDRLIIRSPVADNMLVAAGEIDVASKISGDLLCASGAVYIDGPVDGDISCAAGTIVINGRVSGDVRVFGGNVELNSRIDGDLIVMGGNVQLKNSATVKRDTIIRGGNVVFLGTANNMDIQGVAVVFGGLATGNVFVTGQTVSFQKGSFVAGNLTYGSTKNVDLSNVRVDGSTYRKVLEPRPTVKQNYYKNTFYAFLAMTLIGIIFVLLLPYHARLISYKCGENLWTCLGLGLVIFVVTPFIVLGLLFTFIGIPLALILGFLYLVVVYTAKLATGFWFSTTFSEGKVMRLLMLAFGLFLVYVAVSLPYIGWIINALVALLGIGAFAMACLHTMRLSRKKRN